MTEKIEEGYEQGIRDMMKIEQELGFEKVRQLSKYQGVTSLNRDQAMEIMSTIWPEAPYADKLAAAMLCATYGLNPLANHIFLIPYKENRTGITTWSRVWGIRAKRLLATRRGTFSYLDMSPRLMTPDEQIKVWGEVDKAHLCYLTHLRDMKTGAEVYGYGKWPRDTQPKGTSKGNSQANMASIRSESQAIDRLRPAEMPSGFTVTDEDYVDAAVAETTADLTEKYKDILTPPTITPDNAIKQGIEEQVGVDTPVTDGSAVTAESQSPIDLPWLKERLTELKWKNSEVIAWLAGKQLFKGVNLTGSLSQVVERLSNEQAAFLVAEIDERLKMA